MLARLKSLTPSSHSSGRRYAPSSRRKANRKSRMSRLLTTKGPCNAVHDMLAQLDDRPNLTRQQVAISVLSGATVSFAYATTSWTNQMSWLGQMSVTASVFLMAMTYCMNSFTEAHYARRSSPITALADQDSHFVNIGGTGIHAKRRTGKDTPDRSMHCFHGFGASLESWDSIQQSLAARCGAVVTAHDMPGFGLSERSAEISFYSQDQNAKIGLQVMDDLRQTILPRDVDKQKAKRVLIGHSMGGASAAAALLLQPQDIEALVLIAPTVMVNPGLVPLEVCELGVVGSAPVIDFSIAVHPHRSARQELEHSNPTKWQSRHRAFKRLLRILASGCLRATYPFAMVGLRYMVRSKYFWQRGLEVCRFDTRKVTPALLNTYRRPMLVSGWEQGILHFAAARIAATSAGDLPLSTVLQDIWTGSNRQSIAELLRDAAKRYNTRVLIIHGADDNVIPVANSMQLAHFIPGARLSVLNGTGHIPQEESPDELVRIITDFLLCCESQDP